MKKTSFLLLLLFSTLYFAAAQNFNAVPNYTYVVDGITLENYNTVNNLEIPLKNIRKVSYNEIDKIVTVKTNILIVANGHILDDYNMKLRHLENVSELDIISITYKDKCYAKEKYAKKYRRNRFRYRYYEWKRVKNGVLELETTK